MAVDMKNLCDYTDKIRNVSHIFTETLGTTTSYTFLEDTLRPYVKKNLKEYITSHWSDEGLVEIIEKIKKQAALELKEGWVGAVEIPEGGDVNAVQEAVVSYALSQIESDSLEPLYRLIIKEGYSKGILKGHMFPDVLPALKKWIEEGKKIYMYSSGQEMSQQCLISNSVDGDITELISGCFESNEFPRTKSESFRELCKKVDCPADKVAFLTHNAATASAAHKAGLVVIMLSREGNSYIGSCTRESFPVITTFDDISKQICGKRKMSPDGDESLEGKRAKLDGTVTENGAETEKSDEKIEHNASLEATPEDKKGTEAVGSTAVKEAEVEVTVEEEKMEVDEESKGTEENEDDKAADIKIVVTPPDEEAKSVAVDKSKEVKGAGEAKGQSEVVEKKGEGKEEKPEVAVEEADGSKILEEKEAERKEVANVKESENSEDKGAETGEVETKEEKEKTKDDSAADEKAEAKGEEVKEVPSDESKENGVPEEKTDGNGKPEDTKPPSDDTPGSGDSENKEINGNGLNHMNGEGDGVAVGEDTTEKGTEKIVTKKVEKEDAGSEVAAEPVKECA